MAADSASVERDHASRGAGFLQVGRKRGDDEHRLQTFAQKDRASLNEYGRHLRPSIDRLVILVTLLPFRRTCKAT